jgi:hypothetical protein
MEVARQRTTWTRFSELQPGLPSGIGHHPVDENELLPERGPGGALGKATEADGDPAPRPRVQGRPVDLVERPFNPICCSGVRTDEWRSHDARSMLRYAIVYIQIEEIFACKERGDSM